MSKLRLCYFATYKSEKEVPGQVEQILRLRIKSGSATSGPPIGPVLGQYAIPVSKFTTEFNDRTVEIFNDGVEVFVTLYYFVDGSFEFELAIPISSICFRMAVGIKKGSGEPLSRYSKKNKHVVRRGVMSTYMLYEAILYRMD